MLEEAPLTKRVSEPPILCRSELRIASSYRSSHLTFVQRIAHLRFVVWRHCRTLPSVSRASAKLVPSME